jgi:hypothetical protein
MMTELYTTRLGAGQGMIEETRIMLDLWHEGMDAQSLNHSALQSGRFPKMSARRLRNFVIECFKPRYLTDGAAPARWLKRLQPALATREFEQLLFIYTCRANVILADFIREIYWPAYASGRNEISNEVARRFVEQAVSNDKTTTQWSENMIERVAGYLTGTCAEFGLLERGHKSVRRIVPFRIEQRVAAILVYDLRFAGHGDNSIVSHPDWALFGLEPPDVIDELKRLALKDWLIVQAAGNVIRIGWKHDSMEDVIDALTQGEL